MSTPKSLKGLRLEGEAPRRSKTFSLVSTATVKPSSWALAMKAPNSAMVPSASFSTESRQVKMRLKPFMAASSM